MQKHGQRMRGKVAIVTASTKGIGLAIAQRILEEGGSVVVSSRKSNNVEETVAALRRDVHGATPNVVGVVCHVANSEDRKRLIDETIVKFGRIDVLVNNAAVNPFFGATLDTPEAAWDKIFDVNVKAAFLLTKEVVPHMQRIGGGSILFVSSIGGFRASPPLGAYNVSKTALFGLTRCLAQELAGDKIRVNCLAPGIIKTYFSEMLWKSDAAEEAALSQIPMRVLGEPHNCGAAAVFLCSDDAAYITGETMVVAGGMVPSRL
mmetsp:Transcript_36655/g.79225  ORF Transcript_36655/g.79225 Transcript_36655/m.79225 type:complete len:262 (+) Transcript_36655:16-801(+)